MHYQSIGRTDRSDAGRDFLQYKDDNNAVIFSLYIFEMSPQVML